MHRILVIDDDEGIRMLFERHYGLKVITFATSGAEALPLMRDEPFDLVVSDLSLPDTDGIKMLQASKRFADDRPVIVITAFGTVASAVEAMKLGAMDYISKPFQREEMSVLIEKALEQRNRDLALKRLREWADDTYSFSNIVGKSDKMVRLFDLIKRIADTPTTVLIQGESGTGKELIARAIHQNSSRRDREFLGINCGALPESLLESELFGHLKGSFTGASRTKKGLFEEASGGTILLDEISVVSPAVQAKLLRVLQEREIRPVGGNRSIAIDTRVIAATNDDLKSLVEQGRFREDLYFRLSVIPLTIAPLRERTVDIKLLIEHFTKNLSAKIGTAPKAMTPSALAACLEYRWPGNVRELENLIERLLVTIEGDTIERRDLPEEIRGPDILSYAHDSILERGQRSAELRDHVARRRFEVERDGILEAMRQASGNKSQAAKLLGISRGSLYNKLREMRTHGFVTEFPHASAAAGNS